LIILFAVLILAVSFAVAWTVIVVAVQGDAPGCGVGALAFLVLYVIFAPSIWVFGVAGLVGIVLGVTAGLETLEPGSTWWRRWRGGDGATG
jgi:hypothetical protein